LRKTTIALRASGRVLLFVGAVLTDTLPATADEPSVPLQLQVRLTVKVLEYTQSPPPQSVDVINIGILTKTGVAESTRFGGDLKSALDRVDAIARRPHEQSILQWVGVAGFAEDCKRRKLFVLYVTPGFDSEMPVIARALEGVQVITVAATDSYVERGAILGFELVSGHPRMMFNMGQAKQQDVAFRSAVMLMMRIVR
jgi:hypothetical protein